MLNLMQETIEKLADDIERKKVNLIRYIAKEAYLISGLDLKRVTAIYCGDSTEYHLDYDAEKGIGAFMCKIYELDTSIPSSQVSAFYTQKFTAALQFRAIIDISKEVLESL